MKVIQFSGLVLAAVFMVSSCTAPGAQAQNIQNISAAEFSKVFNAENAIVMDVRTAGEVSAGYIPETTVFADINSSDFAKKIAQLDKEKTYIVYCRSGGRSAAAAQYMAGQGFKKVYNLSGGIGSWKGQLAKN